MNHKERLEKLASGEIKGVRLERSTEWITQVIATGFLFLGGIVQAAMMIRAGEPIPEQPSESICGQSGAIFLNLVTEEVNEPDAAELGLPVPDVPDSKEISSGEEDEAQPVEQVPRRGRPRSKTYPEIEPKSVE